MTTPWKCPECGAWSVLPEHRCDEPIEEEAAEEAGEYPYVPDLPTLPKLPPLPVIPRIPTIPPLPWVTPWYPNTWPNTGYPGTWPNTGTCTCPRLLPGEMHIGDVICPIHTMTVTCRA